MIPLNPLSQLSTHEVENQPDERGDLNLFADDAVLRQYCDANNADMDVLEGFGRGLGAQEMREAGRLANRNPPELNLFDRAGRRLDEVNFHPAYHRLMEFGLSSGFAALPWQESDGKPRRGGHATHAAMVYMQNQVEPGVNCPMTMSYAAVPALRADKGVAARWVPRIMSRRYDPSSRPAAQKSGVTLGMAMTEKQGGSDVRSNSTTATPDGADGYRLRGHKWFCSAPMSDAFLTLAQAPGGLTCFLVPRWAPDETRNRIQIQRLKDKLGNRANASAEIEYHDAWAERLGDEGAGVKTIVEMVHHTRIDTAMAPAGLMRAALAQVHWWVAGRRAFQRRLIDQPMMRSVLADLVLDWEGATAIGLHMARAFDGQSDADRALARIGVALAKFLNNKRCVHVVAEAMECLGGSGYVEDGPMPLYYREAPLNSIWEGSGNVICLDVLRSLTRDPLSFEVLNSELDAALGTDRAYDRALADVRSRWPKGAPEAEARWYVERLALLLQASLLLQQAPGAVADAFIATRLEGKRGHVAGALNGLDTGAILSRLGPAG
jgi:putative acyl-CoA dehydrogenase